MLEVVINYVKKEYKWNTSFAGKVVYEYKRFMYLRSIDSNCSPSDSIDQFWKVHILYTENYNSFCIENFGKFIHHNPDTSLDQESKQKTISKTIKLYMRTYPSVTYPDVWDINLELANVDLTKKISNLQIVKLRVIYVYLDETTGKYRPNKKRSCSLAFADKVLDINITPGMTYEDIIKFISSKTSHFEPAIKIYLSNDILTCKYKTETDSSINKSVKIDLNLSKYYIVELEELIQTSHSHY
jgi:uncharacterized protein YeeX (DUF496 family)